MNNELRLLKHSLPAHYRKVVKSKLKDKYTGQYIYLVLSGLRTNDEVLRALVEVANDHKRTQQEFRKAIAKL